MRELLETLLEESCDIKTMEREKRALLETEQELGIKGRIITARDYLRGFSE